MKGTATRLELFKQIIVTEVRMDLGCNYTFKSFGEKWKVGKGTDVFKDIGISTMFFENWSYCSCFEG